MKNILIRLILEAPRIPCVIGGQASGRTFQRAENIAEHLIANGVTVPVRCKMCKHSKQPAWHSAKLRCEHPSHMNSQAPYEVSPDHFCSDGEQ